MTQLPLFDFHPKKNPFALREGTPLYIHERDDRQLGLFLFGKPHYVLKQRHPNMIDQRSFRMMTLSIWVNQHGVQRNTVDMDPSLSWFDVISDEEFMSWSRNHFKHQFAHLKRG